MKCVVKTLTVAMIATASVAPVAGQPYPPTLRTLTLGIDQRANQRFGADLRAALAHSQQTMADRLCIPLPGGAATADFSVRAPGCPIQPPGTLAAKQAIAMVYVLRDGRAWRLFSSHAGQLERPVSLGSVSKAIGLLPALAANGAHVDEVWCVLAFSGVKNADGFTGHQNCNQSEAWISASTALAKSNNLAAIWRARQLDAEALRRKLTDLGLRGVPANYHPAVGLALGTVEFSPRQALECFDALASEKARRATLVINAPAAPSSFAAWCAAAHSTPAGRDVVHQWLAAPAGPGGTAQFLPGLLAGATNLRAKTGTPSDASGRDTGKVLLFSFRLGRHRYTALMAILSPQPSWPLATHLRATDLMPLVRVLNKHVHAADGNR